MLILLHLFSVSVVEMNKGTIVQEFVAQTL